MPLARIRPVLLIALALSVFSASARGEGAQAAPGLLLENRTFRDVSYTVARIDPARAPLRIFWKKPDGTPYVNFHGLRDGLAARGEELLLATNAGIYAEDRTPLGLHVEEGVELRPLNEHKGSQSNFALKPNGVFLVDKKGPRVVTTEAYAAEKPHPQLATQSGPLLTIDGARHPKFQPDSTSLNLRNGIGVTAEGEVVIAISNWPVNLHTFASLFLDELKCPNALYLDGSLSGLYAPALDRTGPGLEYVGMLAVTRLTESDRE